MSEVIEALHGVESIPASGLRQAPLQQQGSAYAAPRVARPRARIWQSSLSTHELDCLLAVLETDLIPRLVRDYAPARQKPLLASASGPSSPA